MALPEGFVAKSTKEYEEIRIPVRNVNLRFNQPLVKIKDLDEVARFDQCFTVQGLEFAGFYE